MTNMYVESGCDIDHEFYLAILVDRDRKSVLVMASTEGVDIEEVAAVTPEAIHKIWADPSTGLAMDECESLSRSLGITGDSAKELTNMLQSLYRMFLEMDCSMIEINPWLGLEMAP